MRWGRELPAFPHAPSAEDLPVNILATTVTFTVGDSSASARFAAPAALSAVG